MERMQNKCILCGAVGLGSAIKGHIQVPLCCIQCSLECELYVLNRLHGLLVARPREYKNPRICSHCNKRFIATSYWNKYCSCECRRKALYERVKKRRYTDKPCVACGKLFYGNGNRITCSDACSVKRDKQIRRERERHRIRCR